MRRPRSDRSVRRPTLLSDPFRSRHEWRLFPVSSCHLAVHANEPAHLAYDPVDIGFLCSKTCHARTNHRRVTVEAHFGHPCHLLVVERRQEFAGDEAVPSEAHEWERRAVDDAPPVAPETLAQHVTHMRLMLDHVHVSALTLLRERKKQLQAGEP